MIRSLEMDEAAGENHEQTQINRIEKEKTLGRQSSAISNAMADNFPE